MQQIQMPSDIFHRRVKQDYSDWRTAFPREFYQNGADANSSRIDFILEDSSITVKNDGKPMPLQVCQNALLTLGGTDKGQESVGGFGIAKEILYFAWKEWSIRSCDYRINGRGCYYEIETGLPFVEGVQSTVHRDPQLTTHIFRSYLSSCQSQTVIYLNGEALNQHRKGRRIRDLGWASLHKNSNPSEFLKVRVKGITMFQRWMSVGCDLVLEIHGDTKNILTSNRDGLKEEYEQILQQVLREIQVNKRTSLKAKDYTAIQKFLGYGHTFARKKTVATPNILDAAQSQVASPASHAPHPLATSIPTMDGESEDVTASRPHILVQVDGKFHIPKKWQPDHWQKKTLSYTAMWRLVLRQVMQDNDKEMSFGIGIIIEDGVNALYMKKEDASYFLLNPETVDFSLSTGRMELVDELRLRACHEVAHLLSSTDHDEDFVIKLETVLRNTWKSNKIYKKIAKIRNLDLNTDIPCD